MNRVATESRTDRRGTRRLAAAWGRALRPASAGALVAAMLASCSPLYVMRAAYEEGKILWRREPIANLLKDPAMDGDRREKLALVLAVREYARDVLKLNVGGSYASYSYVDRADLSYVLTAAPKTELRPYTWWFLIVGRVPYKGFFSKEAAAAAAEELRAEGYDTHVRIAPAFSTLGWFDDPLLDHLLKYDKVALADVVFHELFHNTLYVKGAGAFNESVANFVGGRAAIDFFRARSGEGSPEHERAMLRWAEELEFADFIEALATELTDLYAREIPYEDKLRAREAVFDRARRDWQERTAARPGHRFRGFSRQELNNAVLINFMLYLKNLRLFESVYHALGQSLPAVIASVRDAVDGGGDPFEKVRALIPAPASSAGQYSLAPGDRLDVLGR
ncbi:MAG TPA: aminopeptidase [candidate division Zixibacteria bacterium]|nr:aminopeptidase [candidate division Zixibacteria bacterium]